MKKLLYDYAYILNIVKSNTPVRFSLKSIPNQERLMYIINEIESDTLDCYNANVRLISTATIDSLDGNQIKSMLFDP